MEHNEFNAMKYILTLTAIVLSLTACLKEEELKPNDDATPLAQDTLFIDPTGGGTTGGGTGGGTTGGGTNDPEFFNYTFNGQPVNLTSPQFVGSISFGQITSKLSATDFFQIALTLAGRTFPDTTRLSSLSTAIVYNETTSKRYNGESGMLIFTSDSPDKITGEFDVVMKNESNPSDSIIVTNGSFSVNK